MNSRKADPRVIARLRREGLWKKLANYLRVEREMALGRTRLKGKPYWLTVDPTNFCQLECPFCPTGAGRQVRPKASMSAEAFRAVLDEFGDTLIHADFMNWGEPLLNKEIYEMIAAAKACRADTMLSTNFNAFDEKAAERMVVSGLDRVVLSIDGLSQETYAKYRVKGDYAKVVSNLKTLVRVRAALGRRTPRIAWQFLVFKHNEVEVPRVRETALALGADEVGITPAYLPFRPGIKDEWLPEKPEHRMYDPESFPDSPPWHWEKSEAEVAVDVYKKTGEGRVPCNWPWAGIAINPDGSVSPCCSVEEKEYDFGVFGEVPFAELWNGPNYIKAREHVSRYVRGERETIPNSKHACERCFSIGRSRFQLPQHFYGDGS